MSIAMRLRLLTFALIAGLAVAGGLGVYLATRSGPNLIPRSEQSPVLEEAKARGIIPGYRVIPVARGVYDFEVSGGEVGLRFPNACGAPAGCPPSAPIMIQIDYRHTAEAQARAILRITRRWANQTFAPPSVYGPPNYRWHHEGVGYKIIFGPLYYP
jgi:hypothetical protein